MGTVNAAFYGLMKTYNLMDSLWTNNIFNKLNSNIYVW